MPGRHARQRRGAVLEQQLGLLVQIVDFEEERRVVVGNAQQEVSSFQLPHRDGVRKRDSVLERDDIGRDIEHLGHGDRCAGGGALPIGDREIPVTRGKGYRAEGIDHDHLVRQTRPGAGVVEAVGVGQGQRPRDYPADVKVEVPAEAGEAEGGGLGKLRDLELEVTKAVGGRHVQGVTDGVGEGDQVGPFPGQQGIGDRVGVAV